MRPPLIRLRLTRLFITPGLIFRSLLRTPYPDGLKTSSEFIRIFGEGWPQGQDEGDQRVGRTGHYTYSSLKLFR